MYKTQDILRMDKSDFSALQNHKSTQYPIPCVHFDDKGTVLGKGYIGALSHKAAAALDALPFGCETMDLIQLGEDFILCARDKAICAAQYIYLS